MQSFRLQNVSVVPAGTWFNVGWKGACGMGLQAQEPARFRSLIRAWWPIQNGILMLHARLCNAERFQVAPHALQLNVHDAARVQGFRMMYIFG